MRSFSHLAFLLREDLCPGSVFVLFASMPPEIVGDVSSGFYRVLLRSVAVSSNGIACACRPVVMPDNFLHHVKVIFAFVIASLAGLVLLFVLESYVVSIFDLFSLTIMVTRLIDTVHFIPS